MRPATCLAPTRIDLAGGTLDIWPLYLLLPGSLTVNLAVSLTAKVKVVPRRDGRRVLRSLDSRERTEAPASAAEPLGGTLPLLRAVARAVPTPGGYTLTAKTSVPRGSGLGGSSSLAVAALRALSLAAERPLSPADILPLARDLEAEVIRVPTGTQDHFAAAFGGLSALHLAAGAPRREVLRTDLDALASRLALAVVGESRMSAVTNWRMLRAAIDERASTLRRFEAIAQAAREMREALLASDFAAVGEAMDREYEARRRLVAGLETAPMRRVIEATRAAGAIGGKVCGAGGGGGMVFLAEAGRRDEVLAAAAAAGAHPLRFTPDTAGVRP